MMFLPAAILFLAICCGIFGYREDVDMFKKLAWIFVIAAIGTMIVLFLALSVS